MAVGLDSVQKQDNAPYEDSDFYQFSLISYRKKTGLEDSES